MDASHTPEQNTLSGISGTSSLTLLLEQGLSYVQQGHNAEGVTILALVCERLAPDEAHLAAVLDAFSQSQKTYSQAQEELLQASKRFARADAEHQVQKTALKNLLVILLEEKNKVTPDTNRLQHNIRDDRLLHVLRSPPLDLNSNQLPTQSSQRTAENNRGNQSSPLSPSEERASLPALYITCFGHFEVKRLGRPVVLCSNSHGQTILRYLVAQVDHCATSDTLLALLWPDDEPEIAQPRLHTAICALRRSLNHGYTCEPGGGYIVCKNHTYCLNATIPIQTDVDQFLHYYQAGRQINEERVALHEKACRLYTGPFLPEDKYADWSFLQREHLSRAYIDMCRILADHYLKVKSYADAENWSNAILKEDQCNELAYRQLIQIYAAQGRRSEALQQYQRCKRILRNELAVQPLPETVRLYQMILKSDPPSDDEAEI